MNSDWFSSFANVWQSADLPMSLTIAALGLFAIILLITLFRAERSLANGALTVITLLAIGIAVTTMLRASGTFGGSLSDIRAVQTVPSLPALSCLDGIAGESVEAACEKALFASPDSAAAAVSYTAAQITRLASFGNRAAANSAMTSELSALRRTIERDRYGLVAHILMTREGCTPAVCSFYQSLTNSTQITSNMNERFYDGIVGNYARLWNSSATSASSAPNTASSLAGVPSNTPSGKPVSGDFPSASSIPPVNIMTPEPAPQGAQSVPRPPDNAAPVARAPSPPPAPSAPKKQAAQKSRVQAPTSLAPTPPADDN